jgi:hypothetical protein
MGGPSVLFPPLDHQLKNQKDRRQADSQGQENLGSRAARPLPAPGDDGPDGNPDHSVSQKVRHNPSNFVEFIADFKYI